MYVDVITKDFGRICDVFITKRVAGQYYYAKIINGSLEWVRQTHDEQVRPALTLETSEFIDLQNAKESTVRRSQ